MWWPSNLVQVSLFRYSTPNPPCLPPFFSNKNYVKNPRFMIFGKD
jgi:hypothetical protein